MGKMVEHRNWVFDDKFDTHQSLHPDFLTLFVRLPAESSVEEIIRMTGKKGMITVEDSASLRSRYHISDLFELLAPSEGETLGSYREGCVGLNEWMFKVKGGISFVGKRSTKIISNLPDLVSEWKLLFFYAIFRAKEESTHARGIPTRWNNELPEIRRAGVWEDQPMTVNKEAEEDLERRNKENLWLGLALSHEEACYFGLIRSSPEAPSNPSLGLVSSPALVAAPPEVCSDPIPGGSYPQGLVLPPILGDVDGSSLRLNPALGLEVLRTLDREDAGADASRAETFMLRREGSSSEGGTPMRCRVLASIFRKASFCPSNEIFCRPFDTERDR
ncbi:hypothetical protein ACLOJK_004534 [Asimina triloba]